MTRARETLAETVERLIAERNAARNGRRGADAAVRALEAERDDARAEVDQLREALTAIRGAVLGPLDKHGSLLLINEIVGEALYGDFPGTIKRAYEDGGITR